MGLMITHHHAEPLGAEMFLRAYPDLEPSYLKHTRICLKGCGRTPSRRQKDEEVIWNIGFRGQGDVPFWENDPAFDTPEKRGELISSIMQEAICHGQRADSGGSVLHEPVRGDSGIISGRACLQIPEDVILIWADNGYGKMVSRRQGNHNPRVPALPEEGDKGRQGTYYHVSFYDLQAANHITMLPNSMEFVEKELERMLMEAWNYRSVGCQCFQYQAACISAFFYCQLCGNRRLCRPESTERRYVTGVLWGGECYGGSACHAWKTAFADYPEGYAVPFGEKRGRACRRTIL